MEEPSPVRVSGLSGPPVIDEGPLKTDPKTLAQRWTEFKQSLRGTLAGLPRVLRLVWAASPSLTLLLFAVTIVSGGLPAATAYLAKLLTNAVVGGIQAHSRGQSSDPAIHLIVVLVAIQLVIFLSTALLNTLRNIAQQLLQERMQLRIQLMVMEHATRLDLPFFEDAASYDLLRRAQDDSARRPVMMISTAFGLVQTAITFSTMIVLLVAVSPLLAVVALVAPIPTFVSDTRYGWRGFMIARWSSRLLRRMNYLVTLATTDNSAKEVKLFDLGGYFVQRYQSLAQTYYRRQRGLVVSRYLAGFGWGTPTTLVGSVTYLYVALLAVAGRLTLGDLTLYTAAASSVSNSISGLLTGLSDMYEHNLYLSNLFELLAARPQIVAPENPVPLPDPVRGEIEFEHVSFAYPGSGAQALNDVSFKIPAGQTVAVVGRNGAGKSTLLKLLCRLYDPSAGRILLDSHDLRDYDPVRLRSVFGAMFQDYVTYQATAAENIGLGEVGRIEDREAIEEAATKGGSEELIAGLPAGFDTPLGKWFEIKSANLSGGEWQKVALSRAFMREARVLLLDEPTSALDAGAEYELFGRLRKLTQGRTAVFISHRFSTVRRADRILFLEHGKLVEEGSHAELMAIGGRYARLFRLQAAAYTGEEIDTVEEAAVEVIARG
ncbi:MAG TPA: ABC transporter ATP-binding protein [Candidatus Dormibacteraeota bacterium]